MAPRRRSTRKPSTAPRESSPQASDSSALSEAPPETNSDDRDTCPSCPTQPYRFRAGEKDTWIQCDKCKTWFHWRCVGEGADHEALQKWYAIQSKSICLLHCTPIRFCQSCRTANPSLKPTLKPPARKSSRKRAQPDYANLHAGLDPSSTDGTKWVRILETKEIKPDAFGRLKGSEVTLDWLEQDPEAFKEPIVIESPDGLGMRMPDKDLTVADVAEIVGQQTPVEVIGDVLFYTQYFHLAHIYFQTCRPSLILQIGTSQSGLNIIHYPLRRATRSVTSFRSSSPTHPWQKRLARHALLRSLTG